MSKCVISRLNTEYLVLEIAWDKLLCKEVRSGKIYSVKRDVIVSSNDEVIESFLSQDLNAAMPSPPPPSPRASNRPVHIDLSQTHNIFRPWRKVEQVAENPNTTRPNDTTWRVDADEDDSGENDCDVLLAQQTHEAEIRRAEVEAEMLQRRFGVGGEI